MDWADQKHDVFVHFANGDSDQGKIDSRPEAIQEWLLESRSACAEGKIAIALEQRRGALFYQRLYINELHRGEQQPSCRRSSSYKRK